MIITSLQFMPDVEVLCHACKGQTLQRRDPRNSYHNKNIADVLELSIEEAACFFKDSTLISHKLGVLNQLGMGYLKLGQASIQSPAGRRSASNWRKNWAKSNGAAVPLHIG